MRAQLPRNRYSATRDIGAFEAYLGEVPNGTLLLVRCGSRSHNPKLTDKPSGKSSPLAIENETRSFCNLMLGFLRNYVGSIDSHVLHAVNYIQTLCELPLPGQPVSAIVVTNQLRYVVNVLTPATPAPANPPQLPPAIAQPQPFSPTGDATMDPYLAAMHEVELAQFPQLTGDRFLDECILELYKAGALPQ